MSSGLLTNIGGMIFLLAMSAYFSASETAFSSANRTRLRTLMEKGSRRARLVLKLTDQYDRLISTILIGNNIVNIALASLGTMLFVKYYGDELGATLSTVVITLAVLIFGEISPKSIAKDCPEPFALFAAPFLQFLIWIFAPFCFLFSMWKKFLSKLLKLNPDNKISQEELLMFVEEVQQDGSINKNDGELLRNAIEFSEVEAKDILTPRVKIEALPSNCTKEELAQRFQETKFSRLLIYDGSIDHIVGVIHQKMFYVGTGVTEKPLKDINDGPSGTDWLNSALIFSPKGKLCSARDVYLVVAEAQLENNTLFYPGGNGSGSYNWVALKINHFTGKVEYYRP